jgi:iron complex transport system substrate-binding protein
MERVVSLLPSLTETVCALGCAERLVGRSHECDFPAGIERLPACTEPKLDPRAGSAAIDARVKELVQGGLSVYRVDAERLRALAPDLILTQDQCEVCAASQGDVEEALAEWLGTRPRVLSVRPSTLGDVWRDVASVAEALGVEERGTELVAKLTERVIGIGERAAGLGERPRLACLEWLEPLMAAGHWMPELVALAGGQAVFGTPGAPSPWIDREALVAADPDVVVALPCGFDLARTRAEWTALGLGDALGGLRAVRERRVFLADGNALFNRPGPRLVESLEVLAEMLHPGAFRFGHAGQHFERLSS